MPVTLLNFVEGTRFTREKQADQDSPYRNLLRPRIGGIAFVLASLGDQLDGVFDVAIIYPHDDVTMWEFVNGKLPSIKVRARRIDVPAEFMSAAVTQSSPERERLKEWLGGVWAAKDVLIERERTTTAT
jgi:hypothetical protein